MGTLRNTCGGVYTGRDTVCIEKTSLNFRMGELDGMFQELLRLAFRNGVSVTGGYGVRNGPKSPDWDVHITQVEKPSDDAP